MLYSYLSREQVDAHDDRAAAIATSQNITLRRRACARNAGAAANSAFVEAATPTPHSVEVEPCVPLYGIFAVKKGRNMKLAGKLFGHFDISVRNYHCGLVYYHCHPTYLT